MLTMSTMFLFDVSSLYENMFKKRAIRVYKSVQVKLYVEACPMDGNCQFHAVAKLLQPLCPHEKMDGKRLKAEFLDYIRHATTEQVNFAYFANDAYDRKRLNSVEDKRQCILTDPNYWGNHCTLAFFAQKYNIMFCIFTKVGRDFKVYATVGSSPRAVALYYYKGHYDAIRVIKFDDTLRVSLYPLESFNPQWVETFQCERTI